MKQYFVEFESDKQTCGDNIHIYGFASTLKTAKSYFCKIRKEYAKDNPRNIRVYDTFGEVVNGFVPCVYQEN